MISGVGVAALATFRADRAHHLKPPNKLNFDALMASSAPQLSTLIERSLCDKLGITSFLSGLSKCISWDLLSSLWTGTLTAPWVKARQGIWYLEVRSVAM